MRTSSRVMSQDGTVIAYECVGVGPPVVLVGGGLDDGSENAPLARELARSFTTYNYARRGRGHSGDTLPYAVQREIEDIQALIGEAGAKAHVCGVSSGGALALEAAAAGTPIDRLAVYEVPYDTDHETPRRQHKYVTKLTALLAEGRRGAALELFMRVAGSSEEDITSARRSPAWRGLEAIAHTLAYDAACLGDRQPPMRRLGAISQPTLVATGGNVEFFERAADTICSRLPRAERLVLAGQSHVVDAKLFAQVLERFFKTDNGARIS